MAFALDVTGATDLGAGVISGCAVTAGTGAAVNVAAGEVRIGFQRYKVRQLNGGYLNSLVTTNNATGATRYDRVWARYDGSVFITLGTASPPAPADPAQGVTLAMLTVPNGTATPSVITDERVIVDLDTEATDVPVFNRKALKRSDARLEEVRQGGTHTTLIVGDSLSRGYGLAIADEPQSKLRPGVQKLIKGSVGGDGYRGIQAQSGVTAEWTVAGSPDLTDYGYGLGRSAIYMNGAGQSITRTFTGDRFLVFYTKHAAGGGIKVTIDGVARASFGSNAATTPGSVWDSGAIANASHTVKIEPDNTMAAPNNVNGALIEGVTFFNGDYTAGCRFLDGSHSGFMAYNFAAAGIGGEGKSWYQAVQTLPVDLLVIEMGTNEEWFGWGISGSGAYKDSVKSIVDTVTYYNNNQAGAYPAPSVLLVPAWSISSLLASSIDGVAYNNGSNVLYCNGSTVAKKLHDYDEGFTITAGWLTGGSATIQEVMEAPVPGEWSMAKLSVNANATATGQTATINSRYAAYTNTDASPYRHALYELARDNGWAVADLYEIMGWSGDDATTGFGLGDAIHWDASGAQTYADLLCQAITGQRLPA